MRKFIGLILTCMMLTGCATRGMLTVDCKNFDNYRVKLGKTALENDIHNLAQDSERLDLDVFRADLAETSGDALDGTARDEAILLLSGGGQWGSYGANFLRTLHEKNKLPDFRIITGVSTGGLQSLFLAVGTDAAYQLMTDNYAPTRESEVVHRNPQLLAIVTGSMAGLKPLKKKIERSLCPDLSQRCFMDAIAESGRHAYIGFVEAESGDFYFVDAVKLAAIKDREQARTCLTGAALASAAMPAFFQQVKVGKKVYYDGGVRQSVFEARINKAAEELTSERVDRYLSTHPIRPEALANDRRKALFGSARLPIFVVRNGPTTAKIDEKANDTGNLVTNALRAETIIVNQLEIISIAALRIENPVGPIYLTTADGYDQEIIRPDGTKGPRCEKRDSNAMFEPQFMQCLARYGQEQGSRNVAWIALRDLVLPSSVRAATP
ncbi:patatin-like phospholipase family protein [Sphingobium sp. BYY-5]|uniref:patatin-like phospholipase family protein n=1 Tax=Sphingobium sp. BYY-5 TaxID=2926400 RepID=UPI001FA6C8B6|nr:patatin-like phospholipase family protein [Sphingobium sp. BYY-5]MCI4591951.1 patatin-like phospholipase family protein [Sphingobium sp. BYY-5]